MDKALTLKHIDSMAAGTLKIMGGQITGESRTQFETVLRDLRNTINMVEDPIESESLLFAALCIHAAVVQATLCVMAESL